MLRLQALVVILDSLVSKQEVVEDYAASRWV
jgi:hypothetical protein